VKQGGGSPDSQVGTNPIPISNPTNLALFRHKITLYRLINRINQLSFFRLHDTTFYNVHSEVGYELVVGTSWLGYEFAWYDLVRVRVDWKPPNCGPPLGVCVLFWWCIRTQRTILGISLLGDPEILSVLLCLASVLFV